MDFLQAVFAGQELYQVALDYHGPIVFRLLPYSSFLHLQRLLLNHPLTLDIIEDEVWASCVLDHPYQADLDDVLAGTVSTVANLILFLSGLPDLEDKQLLLDYSRHRAETELLLQMQAILCQTFPAYTPEVLEGLTISQLMTRVAQAELVTGQKFELATPAAKKPAKPTPINFEKENRELQEMGLGTDPHDAYGLRR